MYHLPLLPGYGPNTNVRSSAPPKRKKGNSILAHLSEAEENGYEGTYFTPEQVLAPPAPQDGFISPTLELRNLHVHFATPPRDSDRIIVTDGEIDTGFMTEPEAFLFSSNDTGPGLSRLVDGRQDHSPLDTGAETDPGIYGQSWERNNKEVPDVTEVSKGKEKAKEEDLAEVVFFEYGVVVFFGLQERQEMDILDDMKKAGIVKRISPAEDWEVEECHYTVRCIL